MSKFFTLSFDDGMVQDEQIIELMRRYGLKGTFNLNSGLFGLEKSAGLIREGALHTFVPGAEPAGFRSFTRADRIPAERIREVYEGMEIGGHTAHHVHLSGLPFEAQAGEILTDLAALEDIAGVKVGAFAYPYGSYDAASVKILREAGVLFARCIGESGSFAFPEDPLLYVPTCPFVSDSCEELLSRFLVAEQEEDMLFMLWGHGYEMDFGNLWGGYARLERLFAQVSGRLDIIYCTNSEAFTAHSERCKEA